MAHRDSPSENPGVSVGLFCKDSPTDDPLRIARPTGSALQDYTVIRYRRAGCEDVSLLVELRKTVLIAANGLAKETDLSHIDAACEAYFADGEKHTTFLALDGDKVVGVGSVDYHTEMPTVSNPTGKCAFLMNIYTAPEYRHRGIASQVVQLLIEDAREKGVGSMMLEATAAGAPMYRRLGFEEAKGYMRLGDWLPAPVGRGSRGVLDGRREQPLDQPMKHG